MSTDSHSRWRRVTAQYPRPICGGRDWCMITRDEAAAIYPRTPEGAIKYLGEGGYLHRCDAGRGPATGRTGAGRNVIRSHAPVTVDMLPLALRFRAAADMSKIQFLAKELGLAAASLQRLDLGWSDEHNAWTFPMREGSDRVIGIRLRAPDGKKFTVAVGHQGLHVPSDLGTPRLVLLTEGPTDAAAMLDLGFAAIARPSRTGGSHYAVQLLGPSKPEVVVVADNDDAGRRGAMATAAFLRLHFSCVNIASPPHGTKDARAWLQAGATHAEVVGVFAAAPRLGLVIRRGARP